MKQALATVAAKSSKFFIEKLRLGSGSALPGRIALALEPDFIKNFNDQFSDGHYNFFVSGTNGKTTSSGLLASIVKVASSQQPISNALGANLYYGIASELAISSRLNLKLPSKNFVFELDEAAFRSVAKVLKPKAVLLTNIFRDQLDRFGEINATQNLLKQGLQQIEESQREKVKLFLNANDEKIAELGGIVSDCFETYYYQVDNVEIAFKESKSSKKTYTQEIFTASLIERKVDGSLIKLSYAKDSIEVFLPIAGDFNIYNACGAAAAAYHSGISFDDIKKGIETYHSAFGRGEKIQYNGKELNVFLIKNPAGATEVINFVSQFENSKVLIAINDNYADGRDVSWLWDACFENFKANNKNLSFICSGTRAYDMALRLKYAGIETSMIEVQEGLLSAIEELAHSSSENLFVLPTYTALLAINKAK